MDNFQTYSQFLNYVESNYDEEQQITIENFISYYINKYRKFGKYNCKDTYYDDLKSDTTGELHKLGVIGFEFEKKYTMNANIKKLLINVKNNYCNLKGAILNLQWCKGLTDFFKCKKKICKIILLIYIIN